MALDWDETRNHFLATLARHRRARVAVPSTLASVAGVRGRHLGTYVATRA